jgi:maleylacetoacetate isomerase
MEAEMLPVHLLKDGGQQQDAAYDALNPQPLVPLLEDDRMLLPQPLAIIGYLDGAYPLNPLLPVDPRQPARIRALSQVLVCDIHPINNLRVLKYLSDELKVSPEQKNDWYHHWVTLGLAALERQMARVPDICRFCHGDTPTMAGCYLVPQLYNARRFECDLTPFPTLVAIAGRCEQLAAFTAAAPERQADGH